MVCNIRQDGIDLDGVEVPDIFKAKEIRQAAKSFKKRTTAVEGRHPRHFGWLSDELLDAIGLTWHVCEVRMTWPTEE